MSTQDRITKGVTRLQKLFRQNLPVNVASKIIQTAVWPQALFGVEIGALGKDHFRILRHHAAQVIVHHSQVGIAALVTHLSSPILVDPECYAITQAIRAARRFLNKCNLDTRNAFLQCCVEASGRTHSVRGPAAALKNYLQRVGWNLDRSGNLLTATDIKLSICNAPWKTIKRTLEQDWLRELIPMQTERKTLRGAPLPHRELTVKLLEKCPANEQRGLVREIASAYQLETQKQKWTNDSDGMCPYCMKPDSKSHRHYQCQATSSVWEQNPMLCNELEELDDIHVELPVVFQPPELDYLQFCHHQDNPPTIIPEVRTVIQQQLDQGWIPIFYSDGSCFNPATPAASLAAWGLVLSLDTSTSSRQQALTNCNTLGAVSNHFIVVATARCHGEQSIDRAELQAMVFLHECYQRTKLFTDSQYAIDCWKRVLNIKNERTLDFLANSDLLKRLFWANQGAQNMVFKISSHQWEFGSAEVCDNYDMLGNAVADRVAKTANSTLNVPLVKDWQIMQSQLTHELNRRKQHYEMLGKLHQSQTTLAEQREGTTRGTTMFLGRLGKSIYDVMAEYQPQQTFCQDVFWDSDADLDGPWSREVASEVLQFWNDIQWSEKTTNEIGMQGISWTELTLSFLLDRGYSIPTKIPHTDHWAMSLTEVRSGGWGFFHISKNFFWMVQAINKRLDGQLFRNLERGQVRSLQKLGSTNQVKGFLYRPLVPKQGQVIRILEKYFRAHGRCAGLHIWPIFGQNRIDDEFFWHSLKTAG